MAISDYDIFFDEAEHKYLVDGREVPSVTEILAPLHRSYGKINPSVLEYAARRGKAVHEALEVYDLGGKLEAPAEIVPYCEAYLDWAQTYRPKWLGIEQIVYDDTSDYIGTLDRIGYLNGVEFAVVDIKTSQPSKEALVSVCVQTYAYAIAYLMSHDDCPIMIKRYGLFLKSDGSYRFLDCEEYERKYDFKGKLVWNELFIMNRILNRVLATGKERK